MNPYNRRRGSRRFALPRKTRLAISAAVLVALIVCVVLIARGCSSQPPADPVSAPAAMDSPSPQSQSDVAPEASQAPDGGEGESDNGGSDEEEALTDVDDEQVDLSADLNQSSEPSVPFGGRSATIRSIGDIVMHVPLLKTAYNKAENTYDFAPYMADIAPSMSGADYTVINVDGPLSGKKYGAYRGYPQFNTPPHLLYALRDDGVDMLTLANNHALDTYYDGLIATIDNVEKVGLEHVGAYRSQQEYDTPKIVDINGIKVGFLNYTTGTNGLEKKADKAATEYGIRYTNNSNASQDIASLKSAGAEIVVVYMHWGEEYEREVSPTLKKMASTLVGAGADVVVGGHPHVVLPCQWVEQTAQDGTTRKGLVLYSMGNFLSDQRTRYRDSGIIFEFTLQDNPDTGKVEVVSPHYIPTYVHRFKADGGGYDYRVYACGNVIEDRPSGMSDTVFKRVKQVWNEIESIMEGGPATPLTN